MPVHLSRYHFRVTYLHISLKYISKRYQVTKTVVNSSIYLLPTDLLPE